MKRVYPIIVLLCMLFLNVEYSKANSLGLGIGVNDSTWGWWDGNILPSRLTLEGGQNASNVANRFSELGIPSTFQGIDADDNSGTDIDVKAMIDTVASQVDSGGDFYLYLNAHGTAEGLKLGDSNSNDYALSANELEFYLQPYNDINKFVYIDACYSAAFWEGGLNNLENIFFIAAAAADKKTALFKDGTTVSSTTMLHGLSENSNSTVTTPYGMTPLNMDTDDNGRVTPEEFETYMIEQIEHFTTLPKY